MKFRILFLISVTIFGSLSIANIVVLSSGRIDVGTPVCEIFNDREGTHCANVFCSGTAPNFSTCYDSNNNETTLSDQSTQICELPPGGC